MVTCAVPGCNSSKKENPQNYTFHTLPQNIVVREKWLKMINREEWVPRKASTICSKHFEQKCFALRGVQRVKLRSGSIPTLFMPVVLKPIRKVSAYVYRDISPVPSGSTANNSVLDITPREIKMMKTINVLRRRLDVKSKKLKNIRAQKRRAEKRVTQLSTNINEDTIKVEDTRSGTPLSEGFISVRNSILEYTHTATVASLKTQLEVEKRKSKIERDKVEKYRSQILRLHERVKQLTNLKILVRRMNNKMEAYKIIIRKLSETTLILKEK